MIFFIQKGSQEYIDATDLLDLYYEIRDELLVETFGETKVDFDDEDEEEEEAEEAQEEPEETVVSQVSQYHLEKQHLEKLTHDSRDTIQACPLNLTRC